MSEEIYYIFLKYCNEKEIDLVYIKEIAGITVFS
jgi:hypothetical protein